MMTVSRKEPAAADAARSRSAADAPEIDGLVYIADVKKAKSGDLLEVEITGSDEHDLHAKATLQGG